jgi:hypothetical protein
MRTISKQDKDPLIDVVAASLVARGWCSPAQRPENPCRDFVLREFSWDCGYEISSAGEQTRRLRDSGGGGLGARRTGAAGNTVAGKIWG